VDPHVTPAELDGFVLGRLSRERSREVVRHLLLGCNPCRELLEPYLPALFGSRNQLQEAPPLAAYDEVMDRVFASLGLRVTRKTLEESRREALDLLVSGGLEALAEMPPDLAGRPVIEALLERSWALRFEDPNQMVRLARAATIVAGGLDKRELGARETEDLRSRVWMELANAYRVADELDQAEDALGQAAEHLTESTHNGLLGARYFTIAGFFHTARRRFGIAGAALDIASTLYRLHGDEHLAGRSLIMKGIAIGFAGNAEEAIHLIEEGLSSIDESREPEILFSALQSQAWFLADCGRFTEALRKISALKWRRLGPTGRLDELKLRWLEGQIRAGLNELDRAERSLAEVRQGFDEAGLGYKAALAGLELGAVLLRQGRVGEGEGIVRECAAVFLSLQIRRELYASVMVLHTAVDMRQLRLDTLYDVIDRLRKGEQDAHAPAPDRP
jgi:tetratricopeptide (TPR) repeat protein